jgi:hypothetical protein
MPGSPSGWAGPIVARRHVALHLMQIDAEHAPGASGSPLFGFFSLQRLRTGSHLPQAASLQGHPASTFDPSWRFFEPLIFVGRRVHLRFPTTAGHFGHASPASFSVTFRYLLWRCRSG